MAADVRINEVTADMTMADAGTLLTPQVLERIVQVVLRRVREQLRAEQEEGRERALSSARTTHE
jgi:hypothetical protein